MRCEQPNDFTLPDLEELASARCQHSLGRANPDAIPGETDLSASSVEVVQDLFSGHAAPIRARTSASSSKGMVTRLADAIGLRF